MTVASLGLKIKRLNRNCEHKPTCNPDVIIMNTKPTWLFPLDNNIHLNQLALIRRHLLPINRSYPEITGAARGH